MSTVLASSSNPVLMAPLDLNFRGICAKYRNWEDPLSQKIRNAGMKCLENRLLAQELVENTLVDDLYGRPLTSPKMEGCRVWEENDLNHYKLLFGKGIPSSPFDLKPITEKTHEFAKEILRWAAFYYSPIVRPSSSFSSSSNSSSSRFSLVSLSSRELVIGGLDTRLSMTKPSDDTSINALTVLQYYQYALASRASIESNALATIRRSAEVVKDALVVVRRDCVANRLAFEEHTAKSNADSEKLKRTSLDSIQGNYNKWADEFEQKVKRSESDSKRMEEALDAEKNRTVQLTTTMSSLQQRNASAGI